MNGGSLRIAVVAGEPSGDLLGSHLLQALKARLPNARFFGIGGPKMEGQGLDAWYPMEKLAVRGYAEVLRHYREIAGIRRSLTKRLLADPPDAFIGIDAPDFNLPLETVLKARGIRTVHYVSPSIWAWRGGRIKKIGRAVDHMLCLFPFEPELYRQRGIPVTYVGHPMADVISPDAAPAVFRERLQLAAEQRIVALLPGSRQSELHYLADTFVQTARLLHGEMPDLQFLVPLATRETRLMFEAAIYRAGATELPIRLLFGHAHDALGAADVALVASGTATLEAALLKCPHVIAYKMAPSSWWLMKRMAYQPYVGLPNILAGRFVVPEFLQEAATPEALAGALAEMLADKERRAEIIASFTEIHQQLRQNTAERAATAIVDCLSASRLSNGLAVA